VSETPTLIGPKILLEGDSGSGKTYAIGTLVDWAERNNRQVRVLFTENGLETLLGYWRDPPKSPDGKPIRPVREVPKNLAWHLVRTPALGLAALTDAAQKAGLMSYEALTKMTDPSRGANNPYEKILRVLADFPDDRTGAKLGNIGTWKSDTILVIDSLSELANACMKMVLGNKPTAAPPDYGVAQNNLMNLLRYLTQGFEPTVVLTAHVQRQVNEVTGGIQLMVKAIGKAMGDDIPQLFSEVLYAKREGLEWVWDTAGVGVTTKTRYLPITSKIKPDLGTIMDQWLKRGAAF
jgi:hypothetical protein